MSNWNKNKVKAVMRALGKPKSIHTANLEHIKKITGATFVGYQNYQDLYHLRLVRNGVESFYKLHGTPNDMTQKKYDDLLNLIINGVSKEHIIPKLGKNE